MDEVRMTEIDKYFQTVKVIDMFNICVKDVAKKIYPVFPPDLSTRDEAIELLLLAINEERWADAGFHSARLWVIDGMK